VKQYLRSAEKAGKSSAVSVRLKEFAEQPALPVEHLAVVGTASGKLRDLTTATAKLEQMLRNLNAMDFYGEEELWTQLESLQSLIMLRLSEVERRTK
jgi:hypothetical protein